LTSLTTTSSFQVLALKNMVRLPDLDDKQMDEEMQQQRPSKKKREEKDDDDRAAGSPTNPKEQRGGRVKISHEKQLKIKEKEMKQMMVIMLKMQLWLAQGVRDTMGILLDLYIVNSDSDVIKAMKKTGVRYAAAVRKAGANHEYGPPHVHLFKALMQNLVTADIGKANRDTLQAWLTNNNDADETELAWTIRHCRVMKTYRSETVRVALSIENSGVRNEVANAMKQTGAKLRAGRSPKGAMEEHLELFLSELLQE